MKALGFALASLLLLALAPVHADVVVYKGTLKIKDFVSPVAGYPVTFNHYLFVDYGTGEAHTLNYYTKNGQKLGDWTVYILRFADVPLAGGKPGRILADGFTNNAGPASFSFGYLEYRGLKATLTIEKSPANVVINEPKSFIVHDTSVASTGAYAAVEGLVTFQSKTTLEVNAAGLNITDAREAIAQPLRDKGYAIP